MVQERIGIKDPCVYIENCAKTGVGGLNQSKSYKSKCSLSFFSFFCFANFSGSKITNLYLCNTYVAHVIEIKNQTRALLYHPKLYFQEIHSRSRLLQESLSVSTLTLHPKPTPALEVKLKILWLKGGATVMMTPMERGIVGFEGAHLLLAASDDMTPSHPPPSCHVTGD